MIAPEKLTRYLLVPQTRGDKSAFLQRAGYSPENADRLLHDLRMQLLPLEASPCRLQSSASSNEIRGTLTGPNGITLKLYSVLIKEHLSGQTKFITLIPER